MTGARLKHYGWGREGEGMSTEERKFVLGRYRVKFATDEFDTIAVPGLDDLSLREPRVAPPASLAPLLHDRPLRSRRTHLRQVLSGLRQGNAWRLQLCARRGGLSAQRGGDFGGDGLDGATGASLTPFGGGSSVCGGVEPRVDGIKHKAAVTLDLRNLSNVVEVDPVSRAASIEAGTYGPSLENQLKPHGFTLRHFPQSFEFSDAWRLDCDAIGRPFRQSSYSYRRFRRKPAHRDAGWRAGDAPTSGIGCWA